jgi:hypothetical protein
MSALTPTLCGPILSRGRLKHSWLENEVLNKTPEVVVILRGGGGWPELQRFPDEADQACRLADEVEFGFSPARLVDECAALAVLPESQRSAVRQAVHEAYLECFDAQGATLRLREAGKQMKDALNALLVEWDKPDDAVVEANLQAQWSVVLDRAETLRKALDALPKGFVFPW